MTDSNLTDRLRDYAEQLQRDGWWPEELIEAADALDAAHSRITVLEAWKESATAVLSDWEETWVAAGRPGPLGHAKAADVRQRIAALEAERDASDAIAREVSKVYDHLTSGAVSYSHTLASAVIAEHDERCYFRAERDAALAEARTLRDALDAGERAFDRLNEPDELWMIDDSYEHRATGAAIVRNTIRRVLAEEAKSDG